MSWLEKEGIRTFEKRKERKKGVREGGNNERKAFVPKIPAGQIFQNKRAATEKKYSKF